MSLLAHEATHIGLGYLATIGDADPAEEELCYAVQAASGILFDAHLEWRGKQGGGE